MACGGPDHLWFLSSTIRREMGHIFAEARVSASCQNFLDNKVATLPSFAPIYVFPSLSSSDEIFKITLSSLPAEYGRPSDGLLRFSQDIQLNFSRFGTIVDSDLIQTISGVFSGKGYVVFERPSQGNTSTITSSQRSFEDLCHSVS